MPHLSPQTLTEAEQQRLRQATASHPWDHLVFSLALGAGLRLAEVCRSNPSAFVPPRGISDKSL